jgi:hypothetical protein
MHDRGWPRNPQGRYDGAPSGDANCTERSAANPSSARLIAKTADCTETGL